VTNAADSLKAHLGITSPDDVMAFARRRGVGPLVYVTYRKRSRGVDPAWLVVRGRSEPSWAKRDAQKTFVIMDNGLRAQHLEDALAWAASHHGLEAQDDVWSTITGLPKAYFPEAVAKAVKAALRSATRATGGEDARRRGRTPGTEQSVQDGILEALRALTSEGLTWSETSVLFDCHHGVASGQLSVLHQDGQISRLADKRGGQKIYVLPEYVGNRVTEEYGIARNRLSDREAEALINVRVALNKGHRAEPIEVRLLVEALERITS